MNITPPNMCMNITAFTECMNSYGALNICMDIQERVWPDSCSERSELQRADRAKASESEPKPVDASGSVPETMDLTDKQKHTQHRLTTTQNTTYKLHRRQTT